MVGYVKRNSQGQLVPETTAGPAGGTIDALLETQDKDYEVVIGEGKEGESFVGFSGNCSLAFNPAKGMLKVKCVDSVACCSDASCKVDITTKADNVEYAVPFITSSATTNGPNRHCLHKDSDAKLTFNPSKNALTTTCFCGTSTCTDSAKAVDTKPHTEGTKYLLVSDADGSVNKTKMPVYESYVKVSQSGNASTLEATTGKFTCITSPTANQTPIFTPATAGNQCYCVAAWADGGQLICSGAIKVTGIEANIHHLRTDCITGCYDDDSDPPYHDMHIQPGCDLYIDAGSTTVFDSDGIKCRWKNGTTTVNTLHSGYKCDLPKKASSIDYWRICVKDANAQLFGEVHDTWYVINKGNGVLGALEGPGAGALICVQNINANEFWLGVPASSATHTLFSNTPFTLVSNQQTAPSGTLTAAKRLTNAANVTVNGTAGTLGADGVVTVAKANSYTTAQTGNTNYFLPMVTNATTGNQALSVTAKGPKVNASTGAVTAQSTVSATCFIATNGAVIAANTGTVYNLCLYTRYGSTNVKVAEATGLQGTCAVLNTAQKFSNDNGNYKITFTNSIGSGTANNTFLGYKMVDSQDTFTYNPSTNVMRVGTVCGNLCGIAANVAIGSETDAVARPVLFQGASGGSLVANCVVANSNITYNPSTCVLCIGTNGYGKVCADLCGTAQTACTALTSISTPGIYSFVLLKNAQGGPCSALYFDDQSYCAITFDTNTGSLGLSNQQGVMPSKPSQTQGCLWAYGGCFGVGGIKTKYDFSMYCNAGDDYSTRTAYIYCDGSACFNGNVTIKGSLTATSLPKISRSGTNMIVCI